MRATSRGCVYLIALLIKLAKTCRRRDKSPITGVSGPICHSILRPRVAISTNGIRKGAQPAAMKVLFSSPGLQDVWQMHASEFSGQEYTVPGMFIANGLDQPQAAMPVTPLADPAPGQQLAPPPVHNGKAYFFKVVARRDGSFSVTNTRNGFSKTYTRTAR